MLAELLLGPAKDAGDDKDQAGSHGSAKDGKGWDMTGWVRWLEGLHGEYERRMTTMCDLLDQGRTQLKTGRRPSLTQLTARLAPAQEAAPSADEDWAVIETVPMYSFPRPAGGMFVWITMALETHPLARKVAGPRLAQALWVLLTQAPFRVLVAPGTMFAPSEEVAAERAWKCFRLCFAAVERAELEGVSGRFVGGVRRFWGIREVKVIDELLKELEGIEDKGEGMGSGMGMGMLTGMC
jgi:DNA-binding transcriptional MocR family regulator